MRPDTLTALQQSIAHWERLLANEPIEIKVPKHVQEDVGVSPYITENADGGSCALCWKFDSARGCVTPEGEYCPVARRTGHDGCGGSPWSSAYGAYYERRKHEENSDKYLAYSKKIQAEVDFLKSLEPEND